MERTAGISWWLICLILCFGADQAAAKAVDDLGLWNALFAQGKFEDLGWECDRLKWWFDGHLRLLNDTDGFNQSIVRPGIGWTLDEQSTVWAGYGWIHTKAFSGLEIDEHRIWQQWTWSKGSEVWKFGLRSRFEQRFVDLGDDAGLRFRQFFRAQHNLPAVPKITLVCWNELFYNLNDTDWGAQSGFNQNRVFAGVGYIPSPNCRWRVEVGYLNQVIDLPVINDRSHHILSINFFRSP